MKNVFYDKTGRQIQEFDLLKVFHFIGPRRKKYYMYKWVRRQNGHLAGVHLNDSSNSSFWLKAVANKNGVLESSEIIQGYNPNYEDRDKHKLKDTE